MLCCIAFSASHVNVICSNVKFEINIYEKKKVFIFRAMTSDDYAHVSMELMYSPGNIPGLGADLDLFDTCPAGCECLGTCADTCPHQVDYSDLVNSDSNAMLMECNDNCSCDVAR